MKSKKVLAILLSLAIMLTFMPTMAFAATKNVCHIGSGENADYYQSFGAAYDAAQDGQTIVIDEADAVTEAVTIGKAISVNTNEKVDPKKFVADEGYCAALKQGRIVVFALHKAVNAAFVWSGTATEPTVTATVLCANGHHYADDIKLTLNNGIVADEFVAPTCTTPGHAKYTATVEEEGNYKYSDTKDFPNIAATGHKLRADWTNASTGKYYQDGAEKLIPTVTCANNPEEMFTATVSHIITPEEKTEGCTTKTYKVTTYTASVGGTAVEPKKVVEEETGSVTVHTKKPYVAPKGIYFKAGNQWTADVSKSDFAAGKANQLIYAIGWDCINNDGGIVYTNKAGVVGEYETATSSDTTTYTYGNGQTSTDSKYDCCATAKTTVYKFASVSVQYETDPNHSHDTKTFTINDVTKTQIGIIPTHNSTGTPTQVIKPATCYADGSKTFTCATCGEKDVVSVISKDTVEHNSGEAIEVPPTCEDAGYSYKVCSVCAAAYAEGVTEGTWEVKDAKGDPIPGSHKVAGSEVPATDHIYDYDAAVTKATWSNVTKDSAEATVTFYCPTCKKVVEKTYKYDPEKTTPMERVHAASDKCSKTGTVDYELTVTFPNHDAMTFKYSDNHDKVSDGVYGPHKYEMKDLIFEQKSLTGTVSANYKAFVTLACSDEDCADADGYKTTGNIQVAVTRGNYINNDGTYTYTASLRNSNINEAELDGLVPVYPEDVKAYVYGGVSNPLGTKKSYDLAYYANNRGVRFDATDYAGDVRVRFRTGIITYTDYIDSKYYDVKWTEPGRATVTATDYSDNEITAAGTNTVTYSGSTTIRNLPADLSRTYDGDPITGNITKPYDGDTHTFMVTSSKDNVKISYTLNNEPVEYDAIQMRTAGTYNIGFTATYPTGAHYTGQLRVTINQGEATILRDKYEKVVTDVDDPEIEVSGIVKGDKFWLEFTEHSDEVGSYKLGYVKKGADAGNYNVKFYDEGLTKLTLDIVEDQAANDRADAVNEAKEAKHEAEKIDETYPEEAAQAVKVAVDALDAVIDDDTKTAQDIRWAIEDVYDAINAAKDAKAEAEAEAEAEAAAVALLKDEAKDVLADAPDVDPSYAEAAAVTDALDALDALLDKEDVTSDELSAALDDVYAAEKAYFKAVEAAEEEAATAEAQAKKDALLDATKASVAAEKVDASYPAASQQDVKAQKAVVDTMLANKDDYTAKDIKDATAALNAAVELADANKAAAKITEANGYTAASVKAVADAVKTNDAAKINAAVAKAVKKSASKIAITSKTLKVKRGKSKAIKVSNPDGQKLTFTKVKGNKKISVTADGKIKLKKKGLKKGKTYKVTVQVTAAANDNVLAGTATKKIKVKVK